MPITAMQKVQIYTHISRVQQLLRQLQQKAIIEITDIDEDFLAPVPEGGLRSKDILEALDFLKSLFSQPPGFMENFIQIKTLLSQQELGVLLKQKQNLKTALDCLQKLQKLWTESKAEESRLSAEVDLLNLYAHFPIPAAKLKKIARVNFMFGTVSPNNYKKWQVKQPLVAPEVTEFVLDRTEKNIYLGYAYFPEQEAVLRQTLSAYGWIEVNLPLEIGDYVKALAQTSKQIKTTQLTQQKLFRELEEFNQKNKLLFAAWADHLQNEEKLQVWSDSLLETKKVAIIEGWIVKTDYPKLAAMLEPVANDCFLIEAAYSADDVPPIVLQNKITRPFEAVTMLYGLPNRAEFDPTPYLAPFFVLFYGLCLSDAGYGLMLLLLAQIILHKYFKHLTDYGKKLLMLNSYCGISTIIVGVLTGSYFGVDLNLIPLPVLKDMMMNLRIIDPVKNPLPMLILAVLLGVVQIYTGLWVRWFIDIQQKGRKEAFLVSGLWVYFTTGLILWPLFNMLHLGILVACMKLVVYTGMIALVLTQGKHHKNPIQRLGSGILSLYRVVGYIGDILSYTRLFALGLVTSVLAMVINYLAIMAGGTPFVGLFFMLLILFLGHTFDFLISIIGSFVHPARLQFVEYFTKFFEGGGRPFKPFVWQTKYIKVK